MSQLQYTVSIDPPHTHERLDNFLARQDALLSRSQAASWARLGLVRVNGDPVKPAHKLRIGDQVEIDVPPPVPQNIVAAHADFEIVFEDDHLIVVDKPQGLSVHPGPGHDDDTLLNGLCHLGIELSTVGLPLRPGVVHRIDLGTSGLLVLAKKDEAHARLAKQFSDHSVERRYLALVWGKPKDRGGRIESELARSPVNRKKFASVRSGGKNAVTHWEYLGGSENISLIALRLETGRTHQIRVHMTELGHPLLGDPMYGRKRIYKHSEELAAAVAALPDQALHAETLGFVHPATGEPMRFQSTPPKSFQEVRTLVTSA
ncbi:MAG: RluA family pseudouridine synthase [Chrysiogenetes bacterium]|nr:RluA family pseudouridine synthase [Chrysiogenetes bacterium]